MSSMAKPTLDELSKAIVSLVARKSLGTDSKLLDLIRLYKTAPGQPLKSSANVGKKVPYCRM